MRRLMLTSQWWLSRRPSEWELLDKSIAYLIPRHRRNTVHRPSTRPKKATPAGQTEFWSKSRHLACVRYRGRRFRIPRASHKRCKMVVGELRWPGEDCDTDQSQQNWSHHPNPKVHPHPPSYHHIQSQQSIRGATIPCSRHLDRWRMNRLLISDHSTKPSGLLSYPILWPLAFNHSSTARRSELTFEFDHLFDRLQRVILFWATRA